MENPVAAAKWYVENLGFRIERASEQPPYPHLLVDGEGSVMLEIYKPDNLTVPDYRSIDPLIVHLAFQVEDVSKYHDLLTEAGAIAQGDIKTLDNGDIVAMLRDPWGFPLQLVKRAAPIV